MLRSFARAFYARRADAREAFLAVPDSLSVEFFRLAFGEACLAMLSKDALRLEMRRLLKGVSASSRREDGIALCKNLEKFLHDVSAHRLFGYMAIGSEPDVTGILQAWLDSGKILCLPRFDEADRRYEMVAVPALSGDGIISGKFGILEPAGYLPAENYSRSGMPSDECVWLVPGLAFDLEGGRLGRGGGYYDRLLEDAPGLKLGIAWDCQIVDAIPRMPFDVAMDYVVTPTRIVPCRPLNNGTSRVTD